MQVLNDNFNELQYKLSIFNKLSLPAYALHDIWSKHLECACAEENKTFQYC